METWRTLHPRRILHAAGAISVHDGVSQASLEPRQSGPELSALPTGQPRSLCIVRKMSLVNLRLYMNCK